MSNTIKLKRGSGSDPSASDLVVGELAIRTDNGKIFTKKDNGSVAEISGSGGGNALTDGDKGDITVSNGGSTFTIDNGVVTSSKIADSAISANKLGTAVVANATIQDGVINNAKIAGSAAIDGSKISPAFTSDITGTGDLTLTSTDTGSSASPIIELYRNSASPADADYLGQLKFTGESDDGSKEVYAKLTGKIDDASSGTEDGLIEFALRKAGSNNIGARLTSTDLKLINGTGLEVAGNISCDGTVDGVDIATRDTLFGGLTSSSGVLTNGVTATTQSAGNNTTRVATTAFVSTAISNLVDSAPGTLNTLNELAAALGDDANFSTTVTNSIATKLPLAGGTLTGGLTGTTAIFSSTSSAPALEAKGDGSSTDGYIQLNCSQNSHGIKLSSPAHSANASYTFTFPTSISSGQFLTTDSSGNTSWATPTDTNTQLSNEQVQDIVGGMVSGNTESGITVTYQDGDGTLDFSVASQTDENFTTTLKNKLDGIAAGATNVTNTNQLTNGAGFITATLTNEQVQDIVGGMVSGNTESGITVTYQDGDGTLDFSVASQTDNNFTDADHSKLDGIEANATADQTNAEIKTAYEANSNTNAFTDALLSKLNGIAASATNVTNNNQLTNGAGYITSAALAGASDGGNAALLDGIDSTQFLRADQDDTTTGNLTISNAAPQLLLTDTNANSDFSVLVNGGSFTIVDETNSANRFVLNSSGNISVGGTITSTFSGNLTGNVTGNTSGSSGSCTGNAATATKLATARNIAGVSFDGSANISLNNNAITNGAGYITSSGTSAACSGNAATATQLQTARTIAGVSFNGTANISLNNNAITNGAGYVTSSVINSLNASNLSSGTIPDARFPSTLPAVDGSNLTGISAGATGGGSDQCFYENDQTVTTNYTITNGKNAMSAGPLTINSGVTVTVGSGETLTIV